MKINKIVYINFVIFALSIIVALVFGIFIIKSLAVSRVSAQEDEADIVPPRLYNIEISNVSATSSIIKWETDELSDSLVNYGLEKNYGVVREPRVDKLQHMIILEELMPSTRYYFRVTSSDTEGNQGISSNYSFLTLSDQEHVKEGYASEQEVIGEGGLSEIVLELGTGGLSQEGLEQLLEVIQQINSEEVLEVIEEKVKEKAEEVISPPTIILDKADVEVGTDYAIVSWNTDKDSNSIVALASEDNYDETEEDPYSWREGVPNDMVLEHIVEINGLVPATIYHFRVSSESTLGLTGYSSDKTFKTKSILPEIYNIQIVKVEEEAATIRWVTNVPCSAIIAYTNLNNNETKLEGNSSFLTAHSLRLTNLIFDTYYSVVIKVESEDGEKTESDPLTFITTRDEYAPAIAKVNTESTIYPGSDNKIQTIVSWETDEDAQCQLFYHQGLVLIDEPETLLKEEDYGLKHVQVVTNFLPSTVYKFWIVCNDEAENVGRSDDYTILTPTQEESIIDIIIKNFESSFGWLKKK